MRKFYFTMGPDEDLPFQEGYVVVWAFSLVEAYKKFMAKYPPVHRTSQIRKHNINRWLQTYEEGSELPYPMPEEGLAGPQQDVIGWPDE